MAKLSFFLFIVLKIGSFSFDKAACSIAYNNALFKYDNALPNLSRWEGCNQGYLELGDCTLTPLFFIRLTLGGLLSDLVSCSDS